MFFGRAALDFGDCHFEGLYQSRPRLRRVDDVIDVQVLGGTVGIGELLSVLFNLLQKQLIRVFRFFSSRRNIIGAAPSAPITASSVLGQQKTKSAPRSLLHMPR